MEGHRAAGPVAFPRAARGTRQRRGREHGSSRRGSPSPAAARPGPAPLSEAEPGAAPPQPPSHGHAVPRTRAEQLRAEQLRAPPPRRAAARPRAPRCGKRRGSERRGRAPSTGRSEAAPLAVSPGAAPPQWPPRRTYRRAGPRSELGGGAARRRTALPAAGRDGAAPARAAGPGRAWRRGRAVTGRAL